ncbi:hypothetical protein GTY49_02520, partial [Streptomyces sp. SID5477]|nr:hypothetical protein [Streptomyces sp. SID5477]
GGPGWRRPSGGCGGRGGCAARRCGVPLRPPVPPQRHDCPQRRGDGYVRSTTLPFVTSRRRVTWTAFSMRRSWVTRRRVPS